jgi:hypothetical protein
VVAPKADGAREYWLIEGRDFAKNTTIGKDTPTCDALLARSCAELHRRAESGMALDRSSCIVIV